MIAPSSEKRKPRVAAIDDDPSMLRLVSLALADDYEVTVYGDPRTALEAFRDGQIPDIVVSDVMMPQMSGFDLHQQARELPQMRSVPFVFLSAMSDRAHQRQGMSQGADDYITKPFRAGELRDALRTRLERTGHLRDGAADGAVLEIASLDGLSFTFQGRRLQWEARKAALLVIYLLEHDRSAPLRELLTALWSEPVQDNTVRVLINRARRMLDGVAEIRVQDEVAWLELNHPFTWDARNFEHSAGSALSAGDPGRIEAAIMLYAGEFLPDLDSPWLDMQRAHYENLYLALLNAAVAKAETAADTEAARARLQAFYGY